MFGKYRYTQGYFFDGRHLNAIPEVLSQKDASWTGVPEGFTLALV
jgi:hypothetical protein